MNYRVYVEKKPEFQIEAKSLASELNLNLGLKLNEVRFINVYDVFNCDEDLLEKAKYKVFGEIVTDVVSLELDMTGYKAFAMEYLPGQFDQRADAAMSCMMLIGPNSKVEIRSGKIFLFENVVTDEELSKIKKYLINAVEAREKDLNVLTNEMNTSVKKVEILNGFRNITDYEEVCKKFGLAMNSDDVKTVVDYFKAEGRDPYETELRILDTYWSDHCRHTTFTTRLDDVKFLDSPLKSNLEESYKLYLELRKLTGREKKNLCLMDLACIGAIALRKSGNLDDLEVSEENNACSIYVDIENSGKKERWLLQFKNETHNHPTEIEPFGGASTCLGGAIRDPLSGRSYVYQAMRVTGAGNIYEEVKNTIPGKLPQRIISTKAAAGYSSYGNQIGLATTHVREIYHPNYVAKRLEVGAVVGAVKASNVKRESPMPGDLILLLGGKTGRDGIGGATGSSKEHTEKSIELCSSEVQKGNAPEERKLSRLFRREDVTSLIKKSNDFGAGGVSVAIGELADGLDINLDVVPVKYLGLNATELAISESQERMAVVIDPKDEKKFLELCHEENVLATRVAVVTKEKRLVMHYKGEKVVDIKRSFIDSAGALHKTNVIVDSSLENYPSYEPSKNVKESMLKTLSLPNVTSQKGLIEMFDSTIGRSTVLMPFGGKTQRTETQVSCELLPVMGKTNDASMMAYGYNPFISSYSPYLGSMYAIIESISKIVAAGGAYNKIRFSFQEYFKRMNSAYDFGLPLQSLLGALEMQMAFRLPSIGGKDSMSGTYKDISVPPMLMSFGVTMVDARDVISPEFKKEGNYVYLIKHNELENHLPNVEELKNNFSFVTKNIREKKIVSGYALGFGGLLEAVAKMSFGNNIGANINYDEKLLGEYNYGSILVESNEKLDYDSAIFLGKTIADKVIINEEEMDIVELYEANRKPFTNIYKDDVNLNSPLEELLPYHSYQKFSNPKDGAVKVYLPVFPGTNCDYDTARAFKAEGAIPTFHVFKNLSGKDVMDSIKEMVKHIDETDIFVLSGGFSAGDEPDGSGKFISNVLNNEEVKSAINRLLARKGLILGICNGFQALVKSGLLPNGKIGEVYSDSPTLFRNDINRHISKIVHTKVMTNNSPWLQSFNGGEIYEIAVSHGEGKFVVNKKYYDELVANGQIAFQYVDDSGNATNLSPYNPNGSYYAIEGICSPDGLILGKMGHTERYTDNCFKNIYGEKKQNIFKNAVNYFRKLD